MKKLYIVILVLCVAPTTFASDFCDGFKQGYIAGYQQTRNTSATPVVPLCRTQPVKRASDPKSNFEHGQLIGYRKATQK